MHGCTDSAGMKYKNLKNHQYTYWVLLNRVLKLFNYRIHSINRPGRLLNFHHNHNDNKILKSDWLSTALISALIGQFNRTVRVMRKW